MKRLMSPHLQNASTTSRVKPGRGRARIGPSRPQRSASVQRGHLRPEAQYRGTVVRTALLALALPALLACSGGSAEDSSAASTGPATSRGSTGSEAVVRQPEQLTGAQLEGTLPRPSDMSAIFSATQENQSGKRDESFLCGADLDHLDRRNAEAKVGYVAQVGFSATRYSFDIRQF